MRKFNLNRLTTTLKRIFLPFIYIFLVKREYHIEITIADLTCPTPVSVPNAAINCTNQGMVEGTVCHYTCNKGFKLVGDEETSCSNRKWDPPPPTCQGWHNVKIFILSSIAYSLQLKFSNALCIRHTFRVLLAQINIVMIDN